jgi:hypothetical protein
MSDPSWFPKGAFLAAATVLALWPVAAHADGTTEKKAPARAEPRTSVASQPPAERQPPAARKPPPPRPSAAAAVRYSFEQDDVEGELQRPGESMVVGGARPARHPSLIEIRSSFVAAIVRSLDDL